MTTTEYLQREIRRAELSVRRAERKSNTPPEELHGLHEKLEHLQEAMKAVEEHWQRVHEQRGWATGELLTAEQLWDMEGKPVLFNSPWRTEWCVVSGREEYAVYGKTVRFTRGNGDMLWLSLADYGKTWTAYAYQTAHIDREKWEPCEHCKPSKNALDRWGPHRFPIDDGAIYYYDVDDGWEGEEINFCPWCGRPLTDEAWAELERKVFP